MQNIFLEINRLFLYSRKKIIFKDFFSFIANINFLIEPNKKDKCYTYICIRLKYA
jgi:hypothetical protein